MRIALLGSAPSSVLIAPFKNADYDQWIQGRVEFMARAHGQIPGDWDIWGCSPGCWAVAPRATRWFEVHRWEPGTPWLTPEYCRFLMEFKGFVYTGAPVPEIPNHVVYPIDRMEEKFTSYFFTSSLALMTALAIDVIEQIRAARRCVAVSRTWAQDQLPPGIDPSELDKDDGEDAIGMWGVDMAAAEEYSYQRPGCQFFLIEAYRRGIAIIVPPESDLMRPMPVYGISEWDHNYVKLTTRARELNMRATEAQKAIQEGTNTLAGVQGEMHALNSFVQTWTSPYGMHAGILVRHEPGTGLGGGISHYDGRPVSRLGSHPEAPSAVLEAMGATSEVQQSRAVLSALAEACGPDGYGVDPVATMRHALQERASMVRQIHDLESQLTTTMKELVEAKTAALERKKKKRR